MPCQSCCQQSIQVIDRERINSEGDEPLDGFHHVPLAGVVVPFVEGGPDSLFRFLVNPTPSPIAREMMITAAILPTIIHFVRRGFCVVV